MFLAFFCPCGCNTCGWQVTLCDPIKHGQCLGATEMKFHVAALYKHTDIYLLLPISARERTKPDTAKVNGKNIHLPLREHCNFSTFQALADLFKAGATSREKPRLNTSSGFR